jgi:hypothetical protein
MSSASIFAGRRISLQSQTEELAPNRKKSSYSNVGRQRFGERHPGRASKSMPKGYMSSSTSQMEPRAISFSITQVKAGQFSLMLLEEDV